MISCAADAPLFATLEVHRRLVTITGMNFIYASLVWILMGTILGVGLLKFINGASIWFLLVPVAAFVVAVGAIGCKTH